MTADYSTMRNMNRINSLYMDVVDVNVDIDVVVMLTQQYTHTYICISYPYVCVSISVLLKICTGDDLDSFARARRLSNALKG